MTRTRLIALILTLFLVSNSVYAQSKKKRSTKKPAKTVVVETPVEPEIPVLPVDTAVVDSVQADTVVIEVPKDRTDTIYYDKTWRVISNKTFATYYRYALYPADSLAPKYFKTFYLNGELQGEGNFIELGDRNDANSIFDGEIDYYYPGGALKRRMFYSNGKSNGECTDYYENGNIKEHISIIDGKKHGINSSFTEDGIVCRLQEYDNDKPSAFYVIVDKDGNYSKYDTATEQLLLEEPNVDERQTEYKNGVAWQYDNKNGLILGVSNSNVRDNIGNFREIRVFLVNKSMINVEIDPKNVTVYSVKKDKRTNFELMEADEYDEKVYKKQVKNKKRSLKKKAVVTIEREDNVSENLGASVFDAGTSNTLKAFQERIISLKTLVNTNRMKYAEREHDDLGYLERTTVHPGEMVAGFLLTDDKKVDDLFVEVTIGGIKYVYEWKTEKK